MPGDLRKSVDRVAAAVAELRASVREADAAALHHTRELIDSCDRVAALERKVAELVASLQNQVGWLEIFEGWAVNADDPIDRDALREATGAALESARRAIR